MKMNIGQEVAQVWERVVGAGLRETLNADLVAWTPERIAAEAVRAAEWQAEYAARTAAEAQAFLGRVVASEHVDGDIRLTYEDGRTVRLIGEWWQWQEAAK